jgi:hypothetical protein
LGIEVDCRGQSGRSLSLIALPEGKRLAQYVRALGSAKRRLAEERLLHHFNPFGEEPGDLRHTATGHFQRPRADRAADAASRHA